MCDVEKYLEYARHITKCKEKTYSKDTVLHRHHIIPRHVWSDATTSVHTPSNLVYLSVEDHVLAHTLYAELHDTDTYEYIMNMRSARILGKKSIHDTGTLARISQTYIGDKNPFYGKSHSKKTRSILSESTAKNLTGVSYEERYGRSSQNEKEKRRLGVRNSWENMTAADRKTRRDNISKSLVGKLSGANNPFATPVTVNGKYYGSISDACRDLGVSKFILKNHFVVIKLEKKKNDHD